jgi:hypothetical protein
VESVEWIAIDAPREATDMKNRNLLIGIGAVAALCICAAVVSALVLREAGSRVMKTLKRDPAEVSKVGEQIADYSVPDGYEQQMAMSLLSYKFVVIGRASGQWGMLIMLAQFEGTGMQASDQEAFEEQMQRSFEQQSGRRGINMRVVEVKQMPIRGEEATVKVSEGTDQSGITLRQLMTVFPGKEGVAMVMIEGSENEWDQEVVDEFLQSIH